MTRRSKREIERELEQLGAEADDGPSKITIRRMAVDERGVSQGVVKETTVRRDAAGEWTTAGEGDN